MEKLTNPLLLNIYGYLDISSLIKIYKLQFIDDFTENEKTFFYKIIWKQAFRNLKYYENLHKPWIYYADFGKFIY